MGSKRAQEKTLWSARTREPTREAGRNPREMGNRTREVGNTTADVETTIGRAMQEGGVRVGVAYTRAGGRGARVELRRGEISIARNEARGISGDEDVKI